VDEEPGRLVGDVTLVRPDCEPARRRAVRARWVSERSSKRVAAVCLGLRRRRSTEVSRPRAGRPHRKPEVKAFWCSGWRRECFLVACRPGGFCSCCEATWREFTAALEVSPTRGLGAAE